MPPSQDAERRELVEASKAALREEIAERVIAHPDRILILVPVRDIPPLRSVSLITKVGVYAALEGYIGAAIPSITTTSSTEAPSSIPWAYELHPYILSEVIEVILQTDELRSDSARAIARELATLIHEHAQAIDLDEVFSFLAPPSLVMHIEAMTSSMRKTLRASLAQRLTAYGLTIRGGAITQELQIRRNR